MKVYYNDNDRGACAWLRELMVDGLIPEGVVDERSIVEVGPADLLGFDQCHLFGGIGGWSRALQLAGWDAARPVWTASCPCQPFSAAGKQKGEKDERHLWPELRRLIAECRPATLIGEQVASGLGREWLSRVRSDLEDLGYAIGAADLCAASQGAPHIRQRLFWVAVAEREEGRTPERPAGGNGKAAAGPSVEPGRCSDACGLDDAAVARAGLGGATEQGGDRTDDGVPIETGPRACGVFHPASPRRQGHGELQGEDGGNGGLCPEDGSVRPAGEPGFWDASIAIYCRDGKYRRIPAQAESGEIESALFPLAPGLPGRVGLLRGAGNAICPEVAGQFIKAFLEAEKELI